MGFIGGYMVRKTLERSKDRMKEKVIHPGSFWAQIFQTRIGFHDS